MYKKLMEQHGGSIPFTILGGVHHKEHKKKAVKRKNTKNNYTKKGKRRSRQTKRKEKPLPSKGYSEGTIIRHKGRLMKLNSSKKWIRI
jgi:hypothetical protein